MDAAKPTRVSCEGDDGTDEGAFPPGRIVIDDEGLSIESEIHMLTYKRNDMLSLHEGRT
jgi:hypothetical protein